MGKPKPSGSTLASSPSLNSSRGSTIGSDPHLSPQKPRSIASFETEPAQFAVIDNRTVITGSFNWGPSAAHQNDEVLLVIKSSLLADHITREMDRLWRGRELGINERLARKLVANRRLCDSAVRREVARGRSGLGCG